MPRHNCCCRFAFAQKTFAAAALLSLQKTFAAAALIAQIINASGIDFAIRATDVFCAKA